MNRRLLLAFVSVALLALTAGCTGIFGGGEISDDQLEGEATAGYDWNTSTDVRLNVTSDQYRGVYTVENRSKIELFERASLGEETPVGISTVRFRHTNGTVVTLGQDHVEKTKSETIITLPADEGQVAFTAPHGGKTFNIPTYVDGSYEVVLPKGMRVGNMLLSQVRPDDHTTDLRDGRVHIVWADVTSDNVIVRYYLARDLLIFGGIIAAGVLVALLGLVYFRFQIQKLERRREEMGLNVDTSDDEFDQDPPPGMG